MFRCGIYIDIYIMGGVGWESECVELVRRVREVGNGKCLKCREGKCLKCAKVPKVQESFHSIIQEG